MQPSPNQYRDIFITLKRNSLPIRGYSVFSLDLLLLLSLPENLCCRCCIALVVSNSVWPHRQQPTRLPIPGILQARTLEWVAISFSNAWKWKVKAKSLSRVRLLATPWTAAYQALPSMGFSRQEYWSGVPLPSPFYGWIIFNCLYVPQLLYPFICRWTSRLLLCSSCCK